MRPELRAVSAILLTFALGGCCSMAQGLSALFCGPRPKVKERSHLTPRRALDTLLTGISTDDSNRIFESLGEDLAKRWRVDALTFEVFWSRLKAENTGVFLADQAEVSAPTEIPPRHGQPFPLVQYTLTLPMTKIVVQLKKYFFYRVIHDFDGEGEPREESDWLPRITDDEMRVQAANGSSPLLIQIPGVPWEGLHRTDVMSATIGIEWLVYDFRFVQ